MMKIIYTEKVFTTKQYIVFKTTFNICIYYNMYAKKSIINFNKKMIKNYCCTSIFSYSSIFYHLSSSSICIRGMWCYRITVPVLPFSASFTLSKEVMYAQRPSLSSMNSTAARNFGSML